MRVALISDVHLVGDPSDADDAETQRALVAWLDALNVDQLCILGDLFHHWWGHPGVVPSGLVPTCAALLRVRARGIGLTIVPGNHDFALGPFFHRDLDAQVRGPHVLTVDGRQFLLAHGDEADRSVGYRVTRATLRSTAFAGLMRVLGPRAGDRLLSRLAGHSRAHPANPGPLRQRQQDWALQHIHNGVDCVIVGHVHAPGSAAVGGGRVVHLGGWGVDRTWCLIDGGVPRLLKGPDPAG